LIGGANLEPNTCEVRPDTADDLASGATLSTLLPSAQRACLLSAEMNFWTHIFTPETWESFCSHGGTVTGFTVRYRRAAEKIAPGDHFLCYTARAATWTGILAVTSPCFIDRTPIFEPAGDPYIIRFRVEPEITLSLEEGVPIAEVWDRLERTRGVTYGKKSWAYKVHLAVSPSPISAHDAAVLSEALRRHA